jgi:hypothetical protein
MFRAFLEIPILDYFVAVLFPRDGNVFETQANQNLSYLIG